MRLSTKSLLPAIALVLLAVVAHAAPMIAANPTSVVVADGATGSSSVTWDAGTNYPDAKVWLSVDGVETLFAAGAKGTLQATISAGKTHTFTLYNGDHSLALASAVVTVTAPVFHGNVGNMNPADAAARADPIIDKFIQNVRVLPNVHPSIGHYADISFTTQEPVRAYVTVSTAEFTDFPDVTPDVKSPSFPADAQTASTNELLGQPATQHNLRQVGMGPQRKYSLVIGATDARGRLHRKRASFSTLPGRIVKVVIEKVRVSVDSKLFPGGSPLLERLQFYGSLDKPVGSPQSDYWRFPRDGTFTPVVLGSWLDVNIAASAESNSNTSDIPDQMEVAVLALNPACSDESNGPFVKPTYPADPRPDHKPSGVVNGSAIWVSAYGPVDITLGGSFQPGTGTFKVVKPITDQATWGIDIEATGRFAVSYAKGPVDLDAVVTQGKENNSAVVAALKDAAALNALAARGAALAQQDPLALEIRNSTPDGGPLRRGFDIGMGAAENQTLPGPGKDKIRDSLDPHERPGFNVGVMFSLDRNRNAELAATGAAIAKADPAVAAARTADISAFYWLGFDIATGIFGDPALGARGNTATGPGSLGIRDALANDAEKRGFNAAVAFHLARNYKH